VTYPAFNPTKQQLVVVSHEASAFITACPGAGKTRTMVERARQIVDRAPDRRGVAFLSFTNAAVDELEGRLRTFGILPTPIFPSFIGTFDRFLWQFLIAPFGIEGCASPPRLVPDKETWEIIPFDGAQALPLSCFDRTTGKLDAALAKDLNFDVAARSCTAHEAMAMSVIKGAYQSGLVDFDDVRASVKQKLADPNFSKQVGAALAARFSEIFVDEAQDCNPADLMIVDWLMKAGIVVKVICDPNQSIYKFRGGVTDELLKFADTFSAANRLPMSGNFRSTPAICSAVVALRPPAMRTDPDEPLGKHKSDPMPIYILSYGGKGVSPAIGREFSKLVKDCDIPLYLAPVLSSTRSSGAKAIGQPTLGETTHMTLRLAEAVMNYHFAFAVGNRRKALEKLHRVVLLVQGRIAALSEYEDYLTKEGFADGSWRPEIIEIANALSFDPFASADKWLERARALLAPGLVGNATINQRLRNSDKLEAALAKAPEDSPPARTIHSVKGLEFPGVCVVLTSQKAGQILDSLEGKGTGEGEEDARKIYVACSRAERLLAIAVPKSNAPRLMTLLTSTGATCELRQLQSG
jgi:DNA helicase-2/ATP-dependent DNA helicase PcrA